MKTAQVVCAFPCTGKTEFSTKFPAVLDLDSSLFDKEGFPSNYIKAIKDNLHSYAIILVSTHEEVIQGLDTEGIRPFLVLPKASLLVEYVGRMYMRGDSREFIDFIINNWYDFVCAVKHYDNVEEFYTLGPNEYLTGIGHKLYP